jgi:hypothetical protein
VKIWRYVFYGFVDSVVGALDLEISKSYSARLLCKRTLWLKWLRSDGIYFESGIGTAPA